MRIHYLLIGTAIAIALPVASQAETRGLYLGGAGGISIPNDSKIKNGTLNDKVEFDIGPAGSLSLGYGFGSFRAELEGSIRANDVDKLKRRTFSSPGGDTNVYGVLVNGFYDFNNSSRFTPYIGAGIGLGIIDAKLTGSGGTIFKDTDTALAYQGIVGVSYALNDQLSLTTDYRYLGTTEAKFKGAGSEWKSTNSNHTIFAGLRYSFGAPPSPPPLVEAPPPVAAAKTDYLVFFDWDKSTITAEARKIISDAASESGRIRPITIVVTGHTDTSGSVAYNQRLSERRAAAVKRELISQGVDASLIQTEGRGETELMTPTANSVREPSNRRAQIVLRVG